MGEVDIFGTYHLDRPKKVEDELKNFSNEADVFFMEEPRETSDQSDWNTLLLRNPTIWIAGRFLNFFWGSVGFLLTGNYDTVDAVVTRKVAQERDLRLVPVDATPVRRASEVTPVLTFFSWFWFTLAIVVFAFALALWPKTLLIYNVPLSPFFFVSLSVAMGFLPIVPFAYLTLDERNEVIANNIEDFLKTQDGDTRGCLVVGHKHIGGVNAALERISIEVNETHKPKFFRHV